MTFAPNTANFLTKMTYDRCARPWWVYFATGVPAFLELWLTLSFLDLEDILRDQGFKASGERLNKGRRRRRHGLGKISRGAKLPITRYDALAVRTLLIVTIPLEIIGFAMLAYYATDHFFYRWTSLLENIRCTGQRRTLMRHNNDFGIFPNIVGGAVNLLIRDQTTGIYSDGAFSTGVPFGIYRIIFAVEFDGLTPSGPEEYQVALKLTGNLGFGTIRGSTVTVGGGQGGGSIVETTETFPLFGGGTIGWVVIGPSVPVGLGAIRAHVIVHQLGDD